MVTAGSNIRTADGITHAAAGAEVVCDNTQEIVARSRGAVTCRQCLHIVHDFIPAESVRK